MSLVLKIAIAQILSIAVCSISVHAETLKLNENCPQQGFYKAQDGLCHYALPYRPGIGGHNGQWLPLNVPVGALRPQQIDLGKFLFFDPILSQNQDISCAQCHDPGAGLSDGRKRARGTGGVELARNTPSLWNTAFQQRWFWDGRANSLEEQVVGPLYAHDEMAATPELIESRLNASPQYRALFGQVYGKRAASGKITSAMVIQSLAVFERSLVSFNSRYDHYALGDKLALTDQERDGFILFRSFLTRCSECHTPPLFTNQERLFIGVPPIDGTNLAKGTELRMKIPSLRNLAKSAPYMHAGQFATLDEVVDFYNNGGGRPLGIEPRGRIHWHVRPIGLSDREQKALVAFLHALDDPTAVVHAPKVLPSGLKPKL